MLENLIPNHSRPILKTRPNLFIDFRDSAFGRQAYLMGSSLAVWEIMLLARNYEEDVDAVAKHLGWPELKVEGGFTYEYFPKRLALP